MDPDGAYASIEEETESAIRIQQTTNQTQTESSCPNTLSPVALSNLTSAPGFGTITPNRVFVGGIDFKANEGELRKLFAQYGSVKEVKIIHDRAGVSKGYGFITFETEEDAQKVLQEAKKLNYKDKKLNIGPAIRKQQIRSPHYLSGIELNGRFFQLPHGTSDLNRLSSRILQEQAGSAGSAVMPEAGTMYLTTSSGYPYIYHNGMAYFHPSEVASVPQPWPPRSVSSSPVMVAQPVYQSPTCHYQAPTRSLPSQWQWSVTQSPASSLSFLYLQPSEVVYQPVGIPHESGCAPPPLLVEAAVPELYSDYGVQTPNHQPYTQSAIAMPAPESRSDSVRRNFSRPSSVSLKPQYT